MKANKIKKKKNWKNCRHTLLFGGKRKTSKTSVTINIKCNEMKSKSIAMHCNAMNAVIKDI